MHGVEHPPTPPAVSISNSEFPILHSPFPIDSCRVLSSWRTWPNGVDLRKSRHDGLAARRSNGSLFPGIPHLRFGLRLEAVLLFFTPFVLGYLGT